MIYVNILYSIWIYWRIYLYKIDLFVYCRLIYIKILKPNDYLYLNKFFSSTMKLNMPSSHFKRLFIKIISASRKAKVLKFKEVS